MRHAKLRRQVVLALTCIALLVAAEATEAQVTVETVFISPTEDAGGPTIRAGGETAYTVSNASLTTLRVEVDGATRCAVGDPVDTIPGATWAYVTLGAFGDAGDLLIIGRLDGTVPEEEWATIVQASTAGQVLVHQSNVTPAPGTEAGTTYAGFSAPRLNRAGQLGAIASFAGPAVDCDQGSATYNCEGIWAGDPSALVKTARAGDPAIGIADAVFKTFHNQFNHVAFNNLGQLAFMAQLRGTPIGTHNDTAIYRGSAGSVALLAWEGQTAPGGGIYGNFHEPSIGCTGRVAIWDGDSVYVDGVRVASTGDPAPRGGTIYSIWYPSIDDTMVFFASVDDIGYYDTYMMLVGSELVEIVREGDPAPETGGQTFTRFDYRAAVNRNGHVVFRGRITDGRDGLWIFNHEGAGVLVALEGEPSPFGPVYSDIENDIAGSICDGGYHAFNEEGNVVFRASLADGSEGIFRSAPPNLSGDHVFGSSFESGNTGAWN